MKRLVLGRNSVARPVRTDVDRWQITRLRFRAKVDKFEHVETFSLFHYLFPPAIALL